MSVMWKRRVQNGSWTINHNSVLLPVSPFSFFDFFFFSFWSFSPKQESSPFLRALSLHTYSSKETWNLIQGEDVFDKRVDSTSSCFSKYQSSMSSSCFSNRLSHWVFSWVTCEFILFSHHNHIFEPLSNFPNNQFFRSFFILPLHLACPRVHGGCQYPPETHRWLTIFKQRQPDWTQGQFDVAPTLTPLATKPSRVLKVSLWPFANLVESFLSWNEGKMLTTCWWHVFSSTLWMLYAKILSQIPSKVSISRSSDFTYFVFFFSL